MVPVAARAADKLSGSDAAYLDWAVINCGFKTTEKEHRLADAANATGGAVFQSDFQEQRKKLVAVTSPTAQKGTCDDLKEWYGPTGSRLEALLTWPQAGSAPVSVGKKTTGDGEGKRGRRRGGGEAK